MYAIIENGGKQYKVSEGDVIRVEKITGDIGWMQPFKIVLASDGETVKTAAEMAGQHVLGTIVAQDKYRKIIVFKYKSKKNERKKQGHRQPFTEVKIGPIPF